MIHVDSGSDIRAWLPDFPGLTVPGDRLSDTITLAPLALERRAREMWERGDGLPEPTVPDLWAVHAEYPEALIGFVEVETGGG